ncbi:MAG: alanine--tRNA ligase [Candidatus Nanoarchaeia archaeon]|nr:alanine--tRNA ligase [Candidatus Nanoarchaeia archaeon]MDD3993992.1 alanine--tRNA ligase [Candidatus Nanoarchaeia archaeon]
MVITRKELIQKYIDYFKSRGHKRILNHSLIPENDPTVLFTTAGMHPLVPYLLGESHPEGKRLVNVQRCIRTGDIENVGDTTHHTFFEMLGNWSLGDYFKKDAIEMSFEFLTKVLEINLERFAVSCFIGDDNSPKDIESAKIWESLGVKKERIIFLSKKDNWWGPAGKTGPCGPDTEMFYWKDNKEKPPKIFNPKDSRWVEIWNDVLMGYNKNEKGKYIEAKQKNIDTGMGVERTISILNGLEDNYLADMWINIIKEIELISNKKYEENKKEIRIIADHIKAATFIISDGVLPGNLEQSYVLRRLIRRAIRMLRKLNVNIGEEKYSITRIAKKVIDTYDDYDILQENKQKILEILKEEEQKFKETLEKGLKEFEKIARQNEITCKDAFLLYQSYGFPLEIIQEMADEKGIKIDVEGFLKECKTHQELSRTTSSGKFKSGLADNSEMTKKLHTATHLLNESLRIILDDETIQQKGSNITPERLRFDFNFSRKLTEDELQKIEDLINLKIQSNLPIVCKVMNLEKAKEKGAKGVFDSKYDSKVKVYSIGSINEEFSKEICAGPHVNNTSELGHFKIIKEESVASGIRRIKAKLE